MGDLSIHVISDRAAIGARAAGRIVERRMSLPMASARPIQGILKPLGWTGRIPGAIAPWSAPKWVDMRATRHRPTPLLDEYAEIEYAALPVCPYSTDTQYISPALRSRVQHSWHVFAVNLVLDESQSWPHAN